MEETYLQPLGEIRHLQTSHLLKFGQVDQELVGNATLSVLVSKGVVPGELFGDVISVQ